MMENNLEYPQKNALVTLGGAAKWLKIKFFEFERLAVSAIRLGPFSELIKIRALQLLVYGLIYPITRVALGKTRASQICESLIKTPSPSIFLFPSPLKSQLLIKNNKDWSVVTEMFINNVYQDAAIEAGMTIIDVGAHIGGHTMYFTEKTGRAGKVVAVEPEPQNYKALLENINLNNFKNVIPIQSALGSRIGLEKLYVSPWSTGHSLLPELAEQGDSFAFIQVPITTLDTLLKKLGINNVAVIKIDAEGAEMAILQGAENTLKNNPDVKILVASYHYPDEIHQVRNFLHRLGFKTSVSPFDIVFTL